MIFTDQSPVQFNDPLPESVDVVVIGGGVIGISTAWFLAKSGVSVLVCDKGRVAGEQSSRNWGWIRQQGRDPAELPIVIESINSWQNLSKEIGEDIGFTRQGVLYAAKNDKELAEHEKWMDVAIQHQLDTKMLSGSEVDNLIKEPYSPPAMRAPNPLKRCRL
jgi:glycine/D-amino acid oxidase-like deaminating enzyme